MNDNQNELLQKAIAELKIHQQLILKESHILKYQLE